MKSMLCLAGAVVAGSLVFVAPAEAAVTFTGTSGAKAASVEFALQGGNLVMTLANTAGADVLVPSDVLTGVFFDVAGGGLSLTRTSVVLGAGSSVFYDPQGQPAGGVVGGEWAYKAALAGAPGSRAYGVSSSGLGLFGPPDLFPGDNLAGPDSPDGLQYGLLSAGDDPATGNGGITGSEGLIKSSVVVTLGGAGAGFDLSRIHSVWFQYGTSLDEPGFPGVPAPGAMALLGAAGLVAARRRRA